MDPNAIELVEVTEAAAWERALARAEWCLWQQSWAYGLAARRRGRRVVRLEIRAEGEPVGAVQLTGRTAFGGRLGLWHALGGPVFATEAPAALQAAALRALGRRCAGLARLLVVTPAAAAPEALNTAGLHRVMTGYTTALLDLRDDAAAQLRACNHGWRYELKRPPPAVTFDAVVPGVDPLALAAAMARHEASRRVRGYATVPPSLVAHAARHGRSLLVRARRDGEFIAFMLFMLHGRTATYQVGWTDPLGLWLGRGAHRHVLWRALPALRAAGCTRLDLGGLNLPAGIAAFKLGTGAVPVTLPGSFA